MPLSKEEFRLEQSKYQEEMRECENQQQVLAEAEDFEGADALSTKIEGASSHRSQHLNGNIQSVSSVEHSINQCAIGLSVTHSFTQFSAAIDSLSVFLTLA